MLISDIIYENFADERNLPLGLKGIVCAFIQNGGMLVFVMLISSLIYNYFVKVIEFNYFVERHPWIKNFFLNSRYYLNNNVYNGNWKVAGLY